MIKRAEIFELFILKQNKDFNVLNTDCIRLNS